MPSHGTESSPGSPSVRRAFFGRAALWVRLFIAAPVVVLLLSRSGWCAGDAAAGLDDFGPVPAFELQNQAGRTIRTADLRGAPWVANFIFTRCPSVCPLLTAKMANLQGRTGDLEQVRFVSFSVDPENDTPEKLAAYAERYEADPQRWWFLTGPLSAIERAVVQGFKIHIGEPQPTADDPDLYDIAHGEHFVLVDAAGRLRGYYGSDREGLQALERDLRQLADETR